MTNNQQLLERLFFEKGIALERSNLFDIETEGKIPTFDFAKVEGMLLGLAIGDALGNTSESLTPRSRSELYGEINDYLPNKYVVFKKMGTPSDDTQLAFWTLEQLVEDGQFIPEHLADKFSTERIFGIGNTIGSFVSSMQQGTEWFEAGPRKNASGNGALMRIAPILVPHLKTGGTGLWADTALCAMMTHNDRTSTASCLAFIAMLWELLDLVEPPNKTWWVQKFTEICSPLEGQVKLRPRGGRYIDEFEGSLSEFCVEYVAAAALEDSDYKIAMNSWHSGAFLLETVPSVLLILSQFGHDPEEAIVRAVNDTKDNDTVAAIVGAAVGALHGKKGLPSRWLNAHTGRTRTRDDGKIFELIETARQVFWD